MVHVCQDLTPSPAYPTNAPHVTPFFLFSALPCLPFSLRPGLSRIYYPLCAFATLLPKLFSVLLGYFVSGAGLASRLKHASAAVPTYDSTRSGVLLRMRRTLVFLLLGSGADALLPTWSSAALRSPPATGARARALLRMATSSPSGGGPRGSSSSDTVTREGFLATSAAIVAAALAPEFLTEPRGPPSYDVGRYERIFDTSKKSYLPADPTHLIPPGGGFSGRVVCAGETHTHPLHHRMQFEVIKAMSGVTKAKKEPLAIGLEMFYRQQQVGVWRVPPPGCFVLNSQVLFVVSKGVGGRVPSRYTAFSTQKDQDTHTHTTLSPLHALSR